MATSGNIEFSMNRTDFLEWALRTAQLVGVEQSVSANLVNHASLSLNMLLATWERKNRHLFTEQSATVFLAGGQTTYTLGSAGDHASDTIVETTLSADEASGQTVLSLTSTTGMTANDYIGIVLDTNEIQWTTISVVGASTVTVNDALTSDATSGNKVYTYTTKLARPLRIMSCQLRTGDTDRICDIQARNDYLTYPNKINEGSPTSIYYDPKMNTSGKLYMWPTPNDGLSTLKISYQRSLQAFDSAGNSADLPKDYFLALAFGLAAIVAPAMGKETKAKFLSDESDKYFLAAYSGDREEASTFIKFSRN